jgi:hypothetical protein
MVYIFKIRDNERVNKVKSVDFYVLDLKIKKPILIRLTFLFSRPLNNRLKQRIKLPINKTLKLVFNITSKTRFIRL